MGLCYKITVILLYDSTLKYTLKTKYMGHSTARANEEDNQV